jgi:hypothetical protein
MQQLWSVVRTIFGIALCFSAVGAIAQTTYTQSAPARCALATYECNQIPLGPGAGYNELGLQPGGQFTLYTSESTLYGKITAITQNPPPLKAGASGPFAFTWTAGSVTGSVDGFLTVTNDCHNRCWPQAWIESSTVTVNH